MKTSLKILLLIASFFIVGCKTTQFTKSVNYLSGDAQTLSLRSSGMGINELSAISNAEKNAVEAILFRGIPNSQQKEPLVSVSEKEAKQIYKKYFDEFFAGERYKTFIYSSVPVSSSQFVKGGAGKKTICIDVKVNLKALRQDLERSGVIRKFGL